MDKDFLHDLLHLVGNMVLDMQKHEKKITDFVDKHYKEIDRELGKKNDNSK